MRGDPVDCKSIIIRGIAHSKKKCIKKSGEYTNYVFMPSTKMMDDGTYHDSDGLSVHVCKGMTKEEVEAGAGELAGVVNLFGAMSLHTGKTRDIDDILDVVWDERPENPRHALIKGIPVPLPETLAAKELAEKLSDALIEIARPVKIGP